MSSFFPHSVHIESWNCYNIAEDQFGPLRFVMVCCRALFPNPFPIDQQNISLHSSSLFKALFPPAVQAMSCRYKQPLLTGLSPLFLAQNITFIPLVLDLPVNLCVQVCFTHQSECTQLFAFISSSIYQSKIT